jgi:hypothetical protein
VKSIFCGRQNAPAAITRAMPWHGTSFGRRQLLSEL